MPHPKKMSKAERCENMLQMLRTPLLPELTQNWKTLEKLSTSYVHLFPQLNKIQMVFQTMQCLVLK